MQVNGVDWGRPCFTSEYKARYFNLRACAQVRFRDAVRQGRVAFRATVPMRLREKIIDQGSRLPYHFTESGGLRYVMKRKEDMRADGIKSPDLIAAMSFPFLEGASYIAGSVRTGKAEGVRGDALQQLKARREALRQQLAAESGQAAQTAA